MTAYIRVAEDCEDCCSEFRNFGECGEKSCEGCHDEDDCLLFLKALSGATNLELMSATYLNFGKDLKWFPVFSNLKTLLLNESMIGVWLHTSMD